MEISKDIIEKIKAADTTGNFTAMKLKSASVSAVIHRAATGTDEDIGYVSYYHRNPFIHYWMNLNIWLRGLKRKYGNSFS
jgi:hypothetical protein